VLRLLQATLEELQRLPFIGEHKARAIIDFRQSHGPLAELDELLASKAIGIKTYEAIKPYLKLDGSSQLRGTGAQKTELPASVTIRTRFTTNPGELRNLARGCAYTFLAPPDYKLCRDAGDATQLTDGVHTKGYFWGQKSTVGWCALDNGVAIDLGAARSITGAALYTAGCCAGVEWMQHIHVLVSADGANFHLVADLVALSRQENGAAPVGEYITYCFRTTRLNTHGRFIAFVPQPQVDRKAFFFADEIEVYGADAAAAEPAPYAGEWFRSVKAFARANAYCRHYWNRDESYAPQLLKRIAAQEPLYRQQLRRAAADARYATGAAALQREWARVMDCARTGKLPAGFWRLTPLVARTEDLLGPFLLEQLASLTDS